MSSNQEKKQKTGEEDMFPTVGEQAQEVEYINSSDLRTTGAEDAAGRPVQELESLCMNCHKQGSTKLLMTYIPNFREVVVMSFYCPHCGFRNSEIQSATAVQEEGVEFTMKVASRGDLGRQIVKSEFASCKFPDLDVEIPAGPGRITTIDGLLSGMAEDLNRDQPVRKHVDPEMFEKIDQVVTRLSDAAEGKTLPLSFVLSDPAGNSFVSPSADSTQAEVTIRHYKRTPTQTRQMGLQPEVDNRNQSMASQVQDTQESLDHGGEMSENVPEDLREEVQTFWGGCPSCPTEVATNMKIVNIPHFKDVIIMSTTCQSCGYKSNEVKTGGAIPDKGRRVVLEVVEKDDLTRDILKSETCSLSFPELSLDLTPGTLGGRFTTIEGLLGQVYEQLEAKVLETEPGQMPAEEERRWAAFLARLQTAIDGELMPFTVKMEDPLAASYIQNIYAPDSDPNMIIEDYERTFDENEDLGLNDTNA